MKTYPLNKDCSNGRCERNTYVVCKMTLDEWREEQLKELGID